MTQLKKRTRSCGLMWAFLIAISLSGCASERSVKIETSADADYCAADLAVSSDPGCRTVARVYDLCSM